MNDLKSEKEDPLNIEETEELIELPDEGKVAEEQKGRKLITVMIIAVAVINVAILIMYRGVPVAIDVAGFALSVLVIVGIVLLGLFWKSKPKTKAIPTVNVANIAASVGTPCNPNGSTRIARQAGTPPATAWTVVRTFTQKSLIAKAKKYVPSAKYLTYAFIDVTRTLNYTCQKQVCQNGVWANSGASYVCNVTQNKTFQVFGGPGSAAPLQGWTNAAILQSFSSGYYQ